LFLKISTEEMEGEIGRGETREVLPGDLSWVGPWAVLVPLDVGPSAEAGGSKGSCVGPWVRRLGARVLGHCSQSPTSDKSRLVEVIVVAIPRDEGDLVVGSRWADIRNRKPLIVAVIPSLVFIFVASNW